MGQDSVRDCMGRGRGGNVDVLTSGLVDTREGPMMVEREREKEREEERKKGWWLLTQDVTLTHDRRYHDVSSRTS